MAFKYDKNGNIIWTTVSAPSTASVAQNISEGIAPSFRYTGSPSANPDASPYPNAVVTNPTWSMGGVNTPSTIKQISPVTQSTYQPTAKTNTVGNDPQAYYTGSQSANPDASPYPALTGLQQSFQKYTLTPEYKGESYKEWLAKKSTGGVDPSYNYTAPSANPDVYPATSTTNTTPITSTTNTILSNILDAIRINASKLIADQQKTIDETPGVYQNLKNTTYNQSLAGLPTLYERLANMGASTTGGLSRTEQGRVQSNLQNNLTSLDLQKQGAINDAQHNISDINSDAASQTASQTADYLTNQQTRQDTLTANEQARQDTLTANEQNRQDQLTAQAKSEAWNSVSALGYVDANSSKVLGIPEGTKTSATNQLEWEREQQQIATTKANHETEVTNFVNTIGQYSGNYQKQIDTITNDGDTSNDWQLPYLKTARLEKVNTVAAQKQADANAKAIARTKFNQEIYDRGMEIWKTTGYLPSGYEDYLGYPVGTPTSAQAKINNTKATSSSKKSSSSKTSSSSNSSSSSTKGLSYSAVGSALSGIKSAAKDNNVDTESVKYVADTFKYIAQQSRLTNAQKDALCKQYIGRSYSEANKTYMYTEAVSVYAKATRSQIIQSKAAIVKQIGSYYYNVLLSKHPK